MGIPIDWSDNNHALNVSDVNGSTHTGDTSRFGIAHIDGDNRKIATPDSADWALGTNPFTFEVWDIEFLSLTANRSIFGQWEGPGNQRSFIWYWTTDNNLRVLQSADGIGITTNAAAAWTPSALTNYSHLAYSREGDGTWHMYVEGTRIGTGTDTGAPDNIFNSNHQLEIGAVAADTIDADMSYRHLQLTNGAALYTGASLTVPPFPLPLAA